MKKVILGLVLVATVAMAAPQKVQAGFWTDVYNFLFEVQRTQRQPQLPIEGERARSFTIPATEPEFTGRESVQTNSPTRTERTTTVTPARIPSITSLTPAQGPVGTAVTIQGINLDFAGDMSKTMITFNNSQTDSGTSATSIARDGKSLTFLVPQLNPGKYTVMVEGASIAERSNRVQFIITANTNTTNTVTVSCPANYLCTPGTPTTPQVAGCPSGYICTESTVITNGCADFKTYMTIGSTGEEVTRLQLFLMKSGFLSPSASTGYFGDMTKTALMRYQTSVGLPATGFLGPITVAKLCAINAGAGLPTQTTPTTEAISLTASNVGIVNSSYQTNLTFRGSTVSRPVAQWSLLLNCPSQVDANTVPGAACNSPFKMSSTQNAGNVLAKEFWFRNYSGTTQEVVASLSAYNSQNMLIGTSRIVLSIPPTSTGAQTWSQVTVLGPNGGESFTAGKQVTVTWKTTEGTFKFLPSSKVQIYLTQSDPGKSNIVKAIFSDLPNTGSAIITIPADIPAGSNYKASVTVYAEAPAPTGSAVQDNSDATFSIRPAETTTIPPTSQTPSVRVISPNGGESIQAGNSTVVRYYGSGNGEKIKVDLVNTSTGGSTWIASDIPLSSNSLYYDGSITWNVPSTITPGSSYKIRISKQADNTVLDESNGTFSIVSMPASITILTPDPYKTFTQGESISMKWEVSNWPAGSSFDISLGRLVNGSQQKVADIALGRENSGSATMTWRVASIITPGANYYFKVCPRGSVDKCEYSQTFTVVAPTSSPTPAYSPVE